jgi:hypothetical protein
MGQRVRVSSSVSSTSAAGANQREAGLPVEVVSFVESAQDTIQPFPTFSELYVKALDALYGGAGDCPTAFQTALAAA